jgi:energy-coupling factor transporter ATP-binding protein EcfA2
MITRFRVQNYKALRDVTLDLTPIHVLIGPNDSGKTSILEAIATFSRSLYVLPPDLFPKSTKPIDRVWQRRSDLKISFEASLKTRSHSIVFPATQPDAPFFNRPSFDNREMSMRQPAGAGSAVVTVQPDVERSFVDLVAQISPAHLLRVNPKFLAMPCGTDSRRQFTLDASGFGLASVLIALAGADDDALAKLRGQLYKLFPGIRRLVVQSARGFVSESDQADQVPSLRDERDGFGVFFEFKGQPGIFPASSASDGVLYALALLTILSVPQPPKIILIEEPECGVHPRLLSDLVNIFRELMKDHPDTQLIFTTHSPYLLDELKPEEVTLCRKDPTTGEVRTLRLDKSKRVREQLDMFTLGEIWTVDGEDKIVASADEVKP